MKSTLYRFLLAIVVIAFIIPSILCAETKPDTAKQVKPTANPKTETTPTKSAPEAAAPTKKIAPEAAKYGVITLTQPQAGGYVVQGNDMMIEWSKTGYIPDNCYRITLLKDGAETLQINPSVCVNGYKWKIPSDVWGSGFKVRVETVNKKVAAESAAFSIINTKADLTVSQLTVTPQTLNAGQEATIRARIDNGGQAKSGPMKAFIIMGYCGKTTYGQAKKVEYAVPPLNFGDHTYISHTEKFPAGDICVSVIVGQSWVPGTGDHMQPDQKTVHVSVYGANLPDLVACIIHPRKISVGSPAGIGGFVQNIGATVSSPSKMSIWVEGQGYAEFDVPSLEKGEFRTFQRSVTFQNEGETAYRVDVDTKNVVTETDENNNRVVGKIIHRVTQDPAVKTEEICTDGRRKPL